MNYLSREGGIMQKQSEVYSVFKFMNFVKFYGLTVEDFFQEDPAIDFPYIPESGIDLIKDILFLETLRNTNKA